MSVRFSELDWQREVLRMGIGKLTSEQKVLDLSCNTMRRIYLQVLAKKTTQETQFTTIISMCKSSGEVDLLVLLKYLLKNIRLNALLQKDSWVTDRVSKSSSVKGPSEKTYQALFFSTLYSICSAPWYPTFEMCRGVREKVDLGLIYANLDDDDTKEKYLIEIGVNLASTGDGGHSCQGHFNRQVERYSSKDVSKSIVVMIYTNEHKGYEYFWPTKKEGKHKEEKVQYIIVEHFLEKNPNKISVYQAKETCFEIDISQ